MPDSALIKHAKTRSELDGIAELFREYGASLGEHICSANLADEIAGLPGRYAEQGGALFLAVLGGEPVGCVALRPIAQGHLELKRLYVRPGFRGHGIGKSLLDAAINRAKTLGAQRLTLDTMDSMTAARSLYLAAGFQDLRRKGIDQPIDMELSLGSTRSPS